MKKKIVLTAVIAAAICLFCFGCGGNSPKSESGGGESKPSAREVTCVSDLAALNNSGESFRLAADIDLSSEGDWTPIEGFKGTLDGDGRKITGLTVNARNKESIGLFGTLLGTVKNIAVESVNVTATGDAGRAGIIAGTNKGTIQKATVAGRVGAEYYSYAGGIAGYNDGGKITECINKATVSGRECIGGIVGYSVIKGNGIIDGNVNEGEITGIEGVGGIAGRIKAPDRDNAATFAVSDEINRGAVSGTSSVGGIFGIAEGNKYTFSGTIGGLGGYSRYVYLKGSLLENYGSVTGSVTGSSVGGLIGTANNFSELTASKNKADVTGGDNVGGFVGKAPLMYIKTSEEHTNTVSGKAFVGGFAGQAGVIEGAVNGGTVISDGFISQDDAACSYTGGIAGYCNGLLNCVNNRNVQAQGRFVGGLAGYILVYGDDKVNGNENNGAVSGGEYAGGITGYLVCPSYSETDTHVYTVGYNTNNAAVSGSNCVGGVFGYIYARANKYYSTYYYNSFKISYCVNKAEITGASSVGGVAGGAHRLKTDDVLFETNTTTHGKVLGE